MNTEWLKKKRVLLPAATLLAFGIGVGAGSAGTDSTPKTVTVEKRVEVPGPERIVTKDVPGPERIVTVTKTPASCITALALADDGFELAADGFDFSADAVKARAAYDTAGVNRALAGMTSVSSKLAINAPKYVAAKEACRASK